MSLRMKSSDHTDRAESFINLNRFPEALDEAMLATDLEPTRSDRCGADQP